MRLFIAINFNQSTKKSIQEIISKVKEFSIQGRFVKNEHMHLTLEFLGEIPFSRVDLIKEIMDQVASDPFTIQLNGLGFFKGREGNIYWLGVEGNRCLLRFQNQLHEALKAQGFELEDRPYKPHLTIGRKVKMEQAFNPEEVLNDIRSIKIQVDKIELMKSEQINSKLVYSVVYTKGLQ